MDNKLLCVIFYNQDSENPDVYICCKCGINPRKKEMDRQIFPVIFSQFINTFGICFDGWTCNIEHYIAIYATHMKGRSVETTLISCGVIQKNEL